jgi:hypothetical protein
MPVVRFKGVFFSPFWLKRLYYSKRLKFLRTVYQGTASAVPFVDS